MLPMAGCGYVCPLCEGKEMDEEGNPCSHCMQEKMEWIEKVHGNCSCSDIGKKEEDESEQ